MVSKHEHEELPAVERRMSRERSRGRAAGAARRRRCSPQAKRAAFEEIFFRPICARGQMSDRLLREADAEPGGSQEAVHNGAQQRAGCARVAHIECRHRCTADLYNCVTL